MQKSAQNYYKFFIYAREMCVFTRFGVFLGIFFTKKRHPGGMAITEYKSVVFGCCFRCPPRTGFAGKKDPVTHEDR